MTLNCYYIHLACVRNILVTKPQPLGHLGTGTMGGVVVPTYRHCVVIY